MQASVISTVTALLLTAATAQSSSLDDVLEQSVSPEGIPGVVAMVASSDEVLYAGAFGHADVANDVKMSTDSIFRIASMTKPLTSIAVLQLAEDGKLALDVPMSDFLAEFSPRRILLRAQGRGNAEYSEETYTPTPRQLLSHTSGFVYSVWNQLLFSVTDLSQFTPTSYRDEPLLFAPGTAWHYSTSTDWLGDIVEYVSGKSLEEYFAVRITRPLGMADTAFNLPESKWRRVVTKYQRAEGGLAATPNDDLAAVTHFSGGGGLKSTAPDYVRFMQAVLGANGNHTIVSADTIAEMSRDQIGAASIDVMRTQMPGFSNDFMMNSGVRSTFGLGFQINTEDVPGRRRAGSLAWGGIYNTYFWIDPKSDLCGVLLTQILPFYDADVVELMEKFEHAAYLEFRPH